MKDRTPEDLFNEAEEVINTIPYPLDLFNRGPAILDKALTLFKEAADHGHLQAMYKYARLILINYWNSPYLDKESAKMYLLMAADKGYVKAQFDLWRYYNEGRSHLGFDQDAKEALKRASLIDLKKLDKNDFEKINTYLQARKNSSDEERVSFRRA